MAVSSSQRCYPCAISRHKRRLIKDHLQSSLKATAKSDDEINILSKLKSDLSTGDEANLIPNAVITVSDA